MASQAVQAAVTTKPAQERARMPLDIQLPPGSLGAAAGFFGAWMLFFGTASGPGFMDWMWGLTLSIVAAIAGWALVRSTWIKSARLVRRLKTLDRIEAEGSMRKEDLEAKRAAILRQI